MLSGKSFVVAPMGGIAKQIGWSNFFLLSILVAIPLISILGTLECPRFRS
jgi:hypothetical protein